MGYQRTSKLKKKLVERLLKSQKWRNRSTNWICREAGVSWRFVEKIRALMMRDDEDQVREGMDSKQYPRNNIRETKHGRTRPKDSASSQKGPPGLC